MDLTTQKISKEQYEVVKALLLYYLTTGENPTDGLSLDEVMIDLSKLDDEETPSPMPIIDGMIKFLKPITAATPTVIDDMILRLLDGENEAGLFPLVRAAIERMRRKRELRKAAKASVK